MNALGTARASLFAIGLKAEQKRADKIEAAKKVSVDPLDVTLLFDGGGR